MEIRYLYYEDWEGVYVDGKLFAEGHSISKWDYHELIRHVAEAAPESLEFLSGHDIYDEEFIKEHGWRCPDDYSDVLAYIEEK